MATINGTSGNALLCAATGFHIRVGDLLIKTELKAA
jgi:hypothetical protein